MRPRIWSKYVINVKSSTPGPELYTVESTYKEPHVTAQEHFWYADTCRISCKWGEGEIAMTSDNGESSPSNTLNLVGFGWVWRGLARFRWAWLGLDDGFGWVWLGWVARHLGVIWEAHRNIWEPSERHLVYLWASGNTWGASESIWGAFGKEEAWWGA